METVSATDLKRRLGELLDTASVRKVAIERHGRVVAYLVPAASRGRRPPRRRGAGLTRRQEERFLELFLSGDLRPSRWRRAGPAETMAGLAALLASADCGERARLFALAEALSPGMSSVGGFERWLCASGVEPGRLLARLQSLRREHVLRRGA